MLHLNHKVKVSFDSDDAVYLMDGILCNGDKSLALTTSSNLIKIYDVNNAGFQQEIKGHTKPIRDVFSCQVNPNILYSVQEDTGVMISDLRQGKAVHFLDELCNSDKVGNTVCSAPSGTSIALGASGDINIIDTRNWCSVRLIEDIHTDEITRIRFCGNDQYICSAGEDQMINILNGAAQDEDEMMETVINCQESCNKMKYFPEVNMVGVTGTCENSFLIPSQPEAEEIKFNRRDESSYVVDFVGFNGCLCLLVGQHGDHDVEGSPAGPLDLLNTQGGASLGRLDKAHQDVVRVAVAVHPTSMPAPRMVKTAEADDLESNSTSTTTTAGGQPSDAGQMGGGSPSSTLITAGEDGIIAYWSTQASAPTRSTNSLHASSDSRKARTELYKPRTNLSRPY